MDDIKDRRRQSGKQFISLRTRRSGQQKDGSSQHRDDTSQHPMIETTSSVKAVERAEEKNTKGKERATTQTFLSRHLVQELTKRVISGWPVGGSTGTQGNTTSLLTSAVDS